MDLAFLEPVLGTPGPWASVYMANARPGPGAAAHQQLAARQACQQLARQGAGDAECGAVYKVLSELGPWYPGRAVFAGGSAVRSTPLRGAPPLPDTSWGAVPHLAPLVELAGEKSFCLIAYTDREGADFELRSWEGSETAGTVAGLDWPLHRTPSADWSEQHFQETVENTWEQNAAETAAALATVAEEHRPDLILLAGDPRQRRAVHDRLPVALGIEVAETTHGGRAAGSRSTRLDQEVARLLEEQQQRRHADALARFQAGLGTRPGEQTGAVEGVPAVVEAARERRVETLLITPGAPDPHRDVWAGPQADQLAVRRTDAKYLGAPDATAVRADDALLRAVGAAGGEVIAVNEEEFQEDVRPAGGIGAILRWSHGGAGGSPQPG